MLMPHRNGVMRAYRTPLHFLHAQVDLYLGPRAHEPRALGPLWIERNADISVPMAQCPLPSLHVNTERQWPQSNLPYCMMLSRPC